MFKYFKMKKNEWKIKAAVYEMIAYVMDNQKEIIDLMQKLFISLKDTSSEEIQKEFISKLAEIIHEENKSET